MSREIKFRAWDEREKVMHYDFEFIQSGIEGNDWIVFKSDKHKLDLKPHPFDNPYFSQQLKIMQFTGLKDKNSLTDIYEYDIILPDGTIGGNKYENADLLKEKTNLLVEEMGCKEWRSSEQAAIDRGCKYAE